MSISVFLILCWSRVSFLKLLNCWC